MATIDPNSILAEMQKQTAVMEGMALTMKDAMPKTNVALLSYNLTWPNIRVHLINTLLIAFFLVVCVVSIQFMNDRDDVDSPKTDAEKKKLRYLNTKFLLIVIPICSTIFFTMQLFTPVTFQQLLVGVGYAVGLYMFGAILKNTTTVKEEIVVFKE